MFRCASEHLLARSDDMDRLWFQVPSADPRYKVRECLPEQRRCNAPGQGRGLEEVMVECYRQQPELWGTEQNTPIASARFRTPAAGA